MQIGSTADATDGTYTIMEAGYFKSGVLSSSGNTGDTITIDGDDGITLTHVVTGVPASGYSTKLDSTSLGNTSLSSSNFKDLNLYSDNGNVVINNDMLYIEANTTNNKAGIVADMSALTNKPDQEFYWDQASQDWKMTKGATPVAYTAYHGGNFSSLYPDLTAIEDLTGTSGVLRKSAANT